MNKDNPMITIDDIVDDITYLTKDEIELLKKSYNYALEVHKNQKRLTGDDYIKHPLNVVHILSTINADSDTLIAGMLHDTISVGGVSISDIENNFGDDVAVLVNGVTKINKLHYNGTTEATIANHRKILVGLTEDVRVIFIKLADRLHNMRTMYMLSDEKKKSNAKETLEILTPIAHRLGINQIKSELEDLSLRYLKPDVYFSIVERLNKSKNERNKYVDEMMKNVSNLLNEHRIKHEIKGRAKSIYSIYKKLDKGKRFSDIYDLLALRVFVDTIPDCYQAMGLIHSKYRPVPKRFKDYIAMPKSNMYQSLHTTVFGPDGNFFEIQIRTYEMDEIAERGIASHWSYKEQGKNLMKGMEEKLQFFRSIMEIKESNEDEMIENKMEELKNTVYVYTPKGDVIELPSGSTPIDFAYRVHSKVGDSMVGAIVNEAIVPLDYVLQDNDVIKINTNKNSNGPSKNWIDIAYTQQAKNKIRSFFNKLDKAEYLKKGEELLHKELRKNKLSITEFLDKNITKILENLHLANINDLYINIGNGKVSPLQVIHIIYNDSKKKEEVLLNRVLSDNINEIKGEIIVEGIDDIRVNLAKCCSPVMGDDIIGFIQTGIGINVHRTICPNISNISEKLIDVDWNYKIEKKYSTNIIVYTNDNRDFILDIVSKTQNNNVNIKSINTVKIDGKNSYAMKVSVLNLDVLNKYMNDLEQIKDVIAVERVIK